jgi:hypothetical protein
LWQVVAATTRQVIQESGIDPLIQIRLEVTPDAKLRKRYGALHQEYRGLYEINSPVYRGLY